MNLKSLKKNISTNKSNLYLLFALLVGFAMRYSHLNFQSLWLDEIYTMNMADPANSIKDIYRLSQTNDALSVLYFILLNTVFKIFGFSAVVARFYSLFFGVVAIYFTYLLGKEIRNKNTGLYAALILSVNYFHLFYSQEARVYTMYMAFATLSFLHLIKFLKNANNKTAVYYGLFSLLMILSHFFGLFVLVSQAVIVALWCLYKKTNVKTIIIKGLISVLIIVVGFLPVLPILLFLSKVSGTWIPPLSNRVFADVYSSFFGDSFLLITCSIIFMLFVLFKAFNSKNDNHENDKSEDLTSQLLLLLPWILVCFFIPYIKSFLEFPILQSRYLISILPAIMVLLAIAFDLIKSNSLRNALLVFFMLLSYSEIVIVKHYYKTRVKSDFRGASEFIVNNNAANSKILTTLPYHFRYYLNSLNSKAELEEKAVNNEINELKLDSAKLQPFWVTDAHGRTFDLSEPNKIYLKQHFEEVFSFQSLDAWAKYFVPINKADTMGLLLRLNADNFYKDSVNNNDKNLYLYNNGSVESKSIQLQQGNYVLVLKAFSVPHFEDMNENAHLNLYFNKQKKASYYIGPTSGVKGDTVKFTLSNPEMIKFTIEFDNDVYSKKLDRNLVIRELLFLRKAL